MVLTATSKIICKCRCFNNYCHMRQWKFILPTSSTFLCSTPVFARQIYQISISRRNSSIVPLPATAHAGVEMWDASRHPLAYPTPIPQVGRTELFRSFFVKQLRMLGSLSAIPQSMLWRRHISLHEQILDLPDCLIYEYH